MPSVQAIATYWLPPAGGEAANGQGNRPARHWSRGGKGTKMPRPGGDRRSAAPPSRPSNIGDLTVEKLTPPGADQDRAHALNEISDSLHLGTQGRCGRGNTYLRLIVSVTVVLRLAEPSEPVMVSVKVPVGVERDDETVSVEVTPDGELKVYVVPPGTPVTLQATVPAYPPVGVAVTL